MNELIVKNEKFGELEIYVDENGKVWFPATEVAEMLGYKNPRKAILDHCSDKGVTFRDSLTEGGKQKKKYIDEGNVIRLLAKSQRELIKEIKGADKHE